MSDDKPTTITKQEAAQNVLVALTLQIRARTEELISGRSPLVLTERVVHLIDKTRRRYIASLQQQQQSREDDAAAAETVRPTRQGTPAVLPDGTEVKRYVPEAVSKALFEELSKITFLLILGKVKGGSSFEDQAKEEEEALRRAAVQRRRAHDQLLGGFPDSASPTNSGFYGPSTMNNLGQQQGQQGKSLSFASFPNLVNIAFFGCHIRKLESLSRVARFSCLDTDVPATASMPLLSVFAALRHVEFDLELGMVSPIVEQLSSFCFSLRSVIVTIVESPGINDRNPAGAATAVTMNRRLFADVWRPKGAQVKLLGATQKKNNSSSNTDGNNNNNTDKDDHNNAFKGYWEALSMVRIKGDLSRRRDGRSLAVVMLDDSWRGLKQVTSLSLRGLRFTSFVELNALQSLTHLRDLDLGDNNLTTLAGASESLPKKTLLSLNLDANKLSSGINELNAFEALTALDLSVNQFSEWTELRPLSQNKTLTTLDVRANSLDARAPHERDSVINAEDIVCVMLRVIGSPPQMTTINGYPISGALKTASETGRIKKNVDAILAQEQLNIETLDKANLKKLDEEQNDNNNKRASSNMYIGGNNNNNQSDDDDDQSQFMRRSNAGNDSQHPRGGKKKRVVVKGVPTRVVQLGAASSQQQNIKDGRSNSKLAAGGNNSTGRKAGGGASVSAPSATANNDQLYSSMNQTGLDYLRATFGDQYLMHLPQHEFPNYIDPNDPNAKPNERQLSYEQVQNEIGVAALISESNKASQQHNLDKDKEAREAAEALKSGSSTIKRTPIHEAVQPVLDQFLSELRRHEWYPSVSSNSSESRAKVFPLGCEMMMSKITFENAPFWEAPLLPLAKQSQSQPYAVHPEGREICLVNGSDKSSKSNETHLRFFRKVLFRVVETHVGFTRHLRLEERNLSNLPNSFFQQTPKKLAERVGASSTNIANVIREKTPRLNEIINAQTSTGVTQEQLDNIPAFGDRYPIFQTVLPSDEHTTPVQIAAKFMGVARARGGGIKLGNAARDASGNVAADDDDDTMTTMSKVAPFGSNVESSTSKILSGAKGGKNMGIDEMTELSRHRVFGTGESVVLAGFVVPARIAQEFKRRLVHQLKTAAAKLSIQGVFREWPFVVRGEGSGERKDASVPIEPTGKYLIDRIQQVSEEPESLSRQRIGNEVGASDQELSLRLRRFVFEKRRKFSTEAIGEFDFVSYFNALSPESIMWAPNQERSIIVGISDASLFCAENIDTIDHHTGQSTATSPEEHFTRARRYDLSDLRAILCAFDLSTMRLIFAPSKSTSGGVDNSSTSRTRDLVLLSREPRISLQFLACLVRLRFLPDSPSIVGTDIELPKVISNLLIASSAQATAQLFFRPTNMSRFTQAPFIYVAHVFFKTTESKDVKKPSILNPTVYPMRCVHAIYGGWACARLVITAKDMRLVEVRELTTANPEMIISRSKKKEELEEPFSVDVKQPSQLLRMELAPHSMFPLLFTLVFSTPEAPSRESEWVLCAPHPATLFSIRRELRNVQRSLTVGEFDAEVVDDFTGFPAPNEHRPKAGGGGAGGSMTPSPTRVSVNTNNNSVGRGSPTSKGARSSYAESSTGGANLSFSEYS